MLFQDSRHPSEAYATCAPNRRPTPELFYTFLRQTSPFSSVTSLAGSFLSPPSLLGEASLRRSTENYLIVSKRNLELLVPQGLPLSAVPTSQGADPPLLRVSPSLLLHAVGCVVEEGDLSTPPGQFIVSTYRPDVLSSLFSVSWGAGFSGRFYHSKEKLL